MKVVIILFSLFQLTSSCATFEGHVNSVKVSDCKDGNRVAEFTNFDPFNFMLNVTVQPSECKGSESISVEEITVNLNFNRSLPFEIISVYFKYGFQRSKDSQSPFQIPGRDEFKVMGLGVRQELDCIIEISVFSDDYEVTVHQVKNAAEQEEESYCYKCTKLERFAYGFAINVYVFFFGISFTVFVSSLCMIFCILNSKDENIPFFNDKKFFL